MVIMCRFDDTEVLGDRIEMTWFKDLRKARQQGTFGHILTCGDFFQSKV